MKRSLLALAGGGLGFAYYYFVGCDGGTCPIQSNPYLSSIYGGIVGMLLADVFPRRNREKGPADHHAPHYERQADQQGYESGKFRP